MKACLMIKGVTCVLFMTACSTAIGQIPWHFELENGLPCKLVWQTEPGRTYDLRQTADLLSWTNAPDFPKKADGVSMVYSFAPGPKGFFQITSVNAEGGWHLMQPPGLPAGQGFDFSAVFALNSLQLWVCGGVRPSGDVCVLRSSDAGSTWALPYREAGVGFFGDLQMVTSEAGYAAGGGLRRTSDGGETWFFEQGNLPNPPGTWHNVGPEGWVYGMTVVDADRVWTAGYDGASAGVIFHREPSRPQSSEINVNAPWWLEWAMERTGMYGISAVNATTAWAVGYGGNIWKTTDGQNWGQQTSPTTLPLQDVHAVDADTAWTVGDGGTILKTIDGGTTWTTQAVETVQNLRRICALDSNVAWTVGEGGVILHTVNGGATWTRQFSGTTANLQGVAATDTNTAWVVGDANTLLRTADGGRGRWPVPVITSVTPTFVGRQSSPQMTVTVTGTGFRGGNLAATFGNTPAGVVTWINESTVQVVAPYLSEGTRDLTLINEDGQQATLPRAVTFMPYPVLTRFNPWHGPATGGYQISVEGYNLQAVTSATFYVTGREPEPLAVHVVDSTRILVTVSNSATRQPAEAMLILDTAQNQPVSAGDFLLDPEGGATVAVTSITPTSGPFMTAVTVSGVGFSTNATLEICGQNVQITNRSSTELSGAVRGNQWGVGRLQLVNSETDYITVDLAFHLLSGPSPSLSQVTPNSGPSAGGTTVTITGTDFRSTDSVTFDGYPVNVVSRTPTSMVVVTPPHPPGVVDLFILTDDLERGAASLPAAFTYQ